MDVLLKILILNLIGAVLVDSSVVINFYDDEDCVLDAKLIQEIASYSNVTTYIMNEIRANLGPKMYQEYSKFIDKGARPTGSDALERAIDHMINLTRQNGLNDVRTEELEVPHWVRYHESALLLQPHLKNIAILGSGTSISTPPEGITAKVIVINSFDELAKTDRKHIEGKIVVFDAHFINYKESVIYRKLGASKAAEKGAVAALVRSVTPFSLFTPHTGIQYYENNVRKIPTASITLEDADLLRRLQDRKESIVLRINMYSTLDSKKSRNTLVDLKGKVHPEKLVIVSGHIDSWDVGQGAIDDGGGMMISWFVPVVLNLLNLKPKRTIRAILWTAEEQGMIGAQAYLKEHINELENINFIMESDEGTFKPLGLDVAGSKKARCIVKEVLKQFAPINKMANSGAPGSDIVLFINKGVPGASLLNQNDRYFWYYHSESDTMNVQNMTDVVDCAAFWAAFSFVIADLSADIPRQ